MSMTLAHLRTSERKQFRRCPQRWYWEYRQGLKPLKLADALWFGIGIHEALARWYLPGTERGEHPTNTWLQYCEDEYRNIALDSDFDEREYVEATFLGETMLNGWVNTFGRDEQWEVISPEKRFQFLIKDPRTKNSPLVEYDGTFDLVYRDLADDIIKLAEWKSAKDFSILKTLSLEDQATSYIPAATHILRQEGLLSEKERIEGILYGVLRKAMPDDRPTDSAGYALNQNGSRSKKQPQPLFHREFIERTLGQQKKQIERIQAEYLAMEAMKKKELPIFKNTTRDCYWECPFFTMCELDEQGKDEEVEDFMEWVFTRQDPYADHRKAA